jgi:hypothetical protein
MSIAAHSAVAGVWAPLTFVLVQGVLNEGTCSPFSGLRVQLTNALRLGLVTLLSSPRHW